MRTPVQIECTVIGENSQTMKVANCSEGVLANRVLLCIGDVRIVVDGTALTDAVNICIENPLK